MEKERNAGILLGSMPVRTQPGLRKEPHRTRGDDLPNERMRSRFNVVPCVAREQGNQGRILALRVSHPSLEPVSDVARQFVGPSHGKNDLVSVDRILHCLPGDLRQVQHYEIPHPMAKLEFTSKFLG